ncbi:MAG: efflux RND transporter permease subunit [Polyangiaceae bacterium]|nr:efflux RND transporter permease subunit [Polyangiaceae bacterium]
MQWLAQVCVRRPIFAWVLMLVVVVVGGVSYRGLGVDEFPNVEFPLVIVRTLLPGASPEVVETEVSDRIEGSVNTIGGIDELRSMSAEGISQVIISFTLDRDVDAVAQEVRDRVDAVLYELPRGIDPPVVSRIDPSAMPVLLVAVHSPTSIRDTTELADKVIRRRIENISGVGQVTMIGGKKRVIQVWLDPTALRAAGLTPATVQMALATQSVTVPGGSLETGPQNLSLRVEARVTSIEELKRLVVAETAGRPIRLEELGRVEDGEEESTSYAQIDEERTVVLSVRKQAGTNTVAVVDSVSARMKEIEKELAELHPGVTLEVVRDNSAVVRTGIKAVTEHLIVGALLAAFVVLIFLGNARSTIISALAIPISVIGTFGVMKLAGFTLNFLTLLALALAVGIVIDDAIVVLENVVRYVEEKKKKPFVAAVEATREIGLAVLATTLSLVAVFVPIGFMSGMIGRFLASFGLTMAFAIVVSMLVSFSLTPMLCARWLRPASDKRRPLQRVVDFFYRPIERAYMALLGFCMRHRWLVVLASFAALGSCIPLAKSLPSGFVPPSDKGEFEMRVRTPEGTSVEETRLIAERVAQDARRIDHVTRTVFTIGDDSLQSTNIAIIYVSLTDPATRKETQRDIMAKMREEVIPKHPKELLITLGEVSSFNTGEAQANITYSLSGSDIDLLAGYAQTITDELRQVPGAVDVNNSLILGKPSIGVHIDRERAADLGVRVAQIADSLRLFVGGLKVSTFEEKGEQYDVRLRADARFRADPEGLSVVSVPSSKHGAVMLSGLVHLEPKTGPSRIDRMQRRRTVNITANAAPGVGDSTIEKALQDITAKVDLPPGYQLQAVGMSKEAARMVTGFLMVVGLAFAFMYMVLAAQFESWLHPVTILLALPLTVPFALMSLHLLGQTLNLFSALGLLVLFGVVKKNAILQIDHTNQLRREGKLRLEAILEANRHRLRPILMTTLAFVAGMLPLILSKGIGAGFNQSIAGIVIGGQTLSLLLTLIATPVAYSLFDDLAHLVQRIFRRKPVDRGERELEAMIAAERPRAPAEPTPHPAPGE